MAGCRHGNRNARHAAPDAAEPTGRLRDNNRVEDSHLFCDIENGRCRVSSPMARRSASFPRTQHRQHLQHSASHHQPRHHVTLSVTCHGALECCVRRCRINLCVRASVQAQSSNGTRPFSHRFWGVQTPIVVRSVGRRQSKDVALSTATAVRTSVLC